MPPGKSHIITELEKSILPLQGLKRLATDQQVDTGLGPINQAFPNATFPLAAIHEFCCSQNEEAAATSGFISGLLSSFMQNGSAVIWISSSRTIFPPALLSFGITPDNVIFIDLKKEKDVLCAMEEALSCHALAAVVAEVQDLGFTASRRLQLTVEESRVSGFIIRKSQRKLNTTAALTRWRVRSLPGAIPADLPGVGFPRWQVELLKVRNGKPGSWEISWKEGRFQWEEPLLSLLNEQHRKTG